MKKKIKDFLFVEGMELWDCLIVFLIIMVSNDTVLFGTTSDPFYTNISKLSGYLFFCYFFYKYKKGHEALPSNKVNMLILMSVCILLTGFVNGFMFGYLSRILLIVSGFIYTQYMPYNRFSRSFIVCILVISLYSIIVHVLHIFSPSVLSAFPTIVNTEGRVFTNCYLSCICESLDGRLWGPFREPGVFVIYIILAMVLYIRGKFLKLVPMAIFVTAIILTLSTTGYMALAFVVLFLISRDTTNRKEKKQKIIILLACVAGFYYVFNYTDLFSLSGEVFSKVLDTDNGSFRARFGSIVANLRIVLSNPIFGVGFDNLMNIFKEYSSIDNSGMRSSHNTSTIFMQFSLFGAFFGIITFVGFMKFCRKMSFDRLSFIAIFGALFLVLSGEAISGNLLYYIILGYGFSNYERIETI